jgi:RHS repeat-associated protein
VPGRSRAATHASGRPLSLVANIGRALAIVALLAAEIGPLAPPASAEPRDTGQPAADLDTGGPVDPIDYKFPDDSGGAGGGASVDPSITLRPDFVPPAKPSKKTALQDLWSADDRVWANRDGTYTLEHGRNLNFRDSADEWTAIDLSLVEGKIGEFSPKAAPSVVTLSTSAADGTLAALKGDDATIALRLPTAVAGAKVGDQLQFAGSPVDPVAFVRPTDLGFEFGATFNDLLTKSFVEFVFDAGGLSAMLAKDASTVELRNPKADDPDLVLGSISSPAVIDDAGYEADASNVIVGLTDQGDGTYLLSYLISPAWLDAKERAFPVTLDPSVCIEAGNTSCTVNTNLADIWYGSGSNTPGSTGANASQWVTSSTSTYLHVGRYQATGDPWGQTRAALYFPGVTLQDGAVITAATLALQEVSNYSGAQTAWVQARMINKSSGWSLNNSSVTWNSLASAVNTNYDSPHVHACASNNNDCWLNLDVTSAVRAWYTRRSADWKPNVGFQVRYETEVNDTAHDELSFYRYVNNSDPTIRPKLTITYELGGFGIDFDSATLGQTYAPSAMVAGQTTVLPITITNKGSTNLDATNYRAAYRFFNVKNNTVAASGLATLPAQINAGASSAVFGMTVTPPTTTGQYTLRLDVVKVVNGVNVYYSDWAKPTLFYSRNKKVLTSDSTRWTGSSVMERDEFGITVTNGQGSKGDVKTVSTGDGGELGINLWSRNLSYSGDTGISVSDRIPLAVTYGYNAKDAATCSGYQGILDACGWSTNWDERVVAGATDDAYTYVDPDGNPYLTDTDYDGQLVGGAVQLSRKRVTLFDENRPTSGGSLVAAANEGITGYSGTQVVKAPAAGTTVLGGFVDGSATREINLNAYRYVNFAMRTTASPNVALCFLIDNKTSAKQTWICLEPGPGWNPGWNYVWANQTIVGTWAGFSYDLWGVVSGTVGTYTDYGKKTDDYFIKTIEIIGAAGNTGSVYLDGLELAPQWPWRMNITANITNWTTGSSTYTTDESISSSHGAVKLAAPVTCTAPACFGSFGITENINGTDYPALGSLSSASFLSWWWKKAGGQATALTLCVTDLRNSTTGELTYYAGAAPPASVTDCPGKTSADRHYVQVSPHVPGHYARVIRNVLEDARQILNFYLDDEPGQTSASPPTNGPSPDNVQLTGFTIDPVDGQYLLFTHAELNSGALPSGINRYADWNANMDDLNYAGVISSSDGPKDDFVAEYPDGTFHFFNRDGLLTRIVTKQGAELDLEWTYAGSGTGPSAYTLVAVHAPSDNTDDGGSTTYRHYLAVSQTTPTGFTQTTFTEKLGTVATPLTGRRADFYVATTTGTTWGLGDLVKISPARHNSSTCGSHPSACVEVEYASTTNHLIKRVADPRWDGSGSGATDARLEISYTGSDPMAVLDRSHNSAALLRINTYDHATSTKYRRPLWQDATASAAGYAMHDDLSPDGAVLVEYIRQGPCASSDCTANKPDGTDGTLATRRAREYAFDGLSHVNSVITYRCPGVAVGGCTGTTALRSVTRRGTNAGAKVENYIDVLTANETAWDQSADQYFASLRDSNASDPDLYRTEYMYNAVNAPIVVRNPVFNRVTDYAGTVKATELASLTHYWRLGEANSPFADGIGSASGTGTNVTASQIGALARDVNTAVSLNGTSSRVTASVTLASTAYTLEGWVNLVATDTNDKGMLGRYSSNSGALVYLRGSDGTLALAHNAGRVFSAAKLQTGRWYHVAATWDGSRAYLYLDGDLVGAGSITGAPGTVNPSFEIGSYGNGSAGHFLNGLVDEVSTRSVAVDQSVLRAEYQAGRGVATVRTETTYGSHGAMTNFTHLDADPTQQAVQLVANGDFEEGLTGWNTNHAAVLTDPQTVTAFSGAEALALTGSDSTEQLVQAVPGQRVHVQAALRVSAAGGSAKFAVDYWSISTASWQSLSLITYGGTSWLTTAAQKTVPSTDTTGLLRVRLENATGTATAYFDALLTVTSWQALDYKSPTQYYHGGSGRNAYIGDALVEYVKTISPANTGTRKDRLYYDVETGHAAIWSRRTVANYGDGTPGPNPSDDVTTTTTYDGWGRVLMTTDPDAVVTTTTYDSTNLTDVAQTKDGLGKTTSYAYDGVGNRTSTTTPLGRVAGSTFDFRNQQLTSTDPAGVVTKTDYNDSGQATATWANWIDGNPATGDGTDDILTILIYDEYGRVTRQDVECGSVAACATNGLDARATTSYDLLGNVVASTVYPAANGGGTARVTTNHFERYGTGPIYTRTSPSGVQLPIAPTASPAPLCPGSTNVYCSSASVWKLNNVWLSAIDTNGHAFGSTDGYGVVTLTDSDLAGRPVAVTAGYAAGSAPDSDTNVVTRSEYNLTGDLRTTWDPLGRQDYRTFDNLGRVEESIHYDSNGVEFRRDSTRYLPSGRVQRTSDGSSWTRTLYDGAGRAVQTIANYDTTGNAGMVIEAVEAGESAEVGTSGLWKNTTTTVFVGSAPTTLTTDSDAAGNAYHTVAPASGRGRLHVTTSASGGTSGTWFDLSGPTFQSGHVYKAAFDVMASAAGLQLTAYLGQDQSSGSYSPLAITSATTWERKTVSWTAGSSLSTPIHFALVKNTAGTAELYLDNLVVWDATSGWSDKGIVSSVTAYNDDGEIAASALPPGDPATQSPLVTTVAFDPAGRGVVTTVNGASGAYAATILGTPNLVAYVPLDERIGSTLADRKAGGGAALSVTNAPRLGLAGAIDEARTAVSFGTGYVSRASNATPNTASVSMEAWLRSDAANPGQTLIVASNGTAASGWGIGVDTLGNAAGFTISASTLTTMGSGAKVNDGAWHHLVLTRGATWAMTLDGVPKTLANNTSSPGTPGAGFSIGALSDGTRAFTGEVDEVSVYAADISGSAVAHWSAGRKPTSDTVAALTSRIAFDRLGRPTDTWAPDLIRTKAVFDRLGHQTATIANYRDGTATGGIADDDVKSTYAYDVLGELIGYCPANYVFSATCTVTDPANTYAWHYEFDKLGRQTRTIAPVNQTAVPLAVSETVYQAGGRVDKMCTYPAGPTAACADPNSRHTNFASYDDLGRVLTRETWERTGGSDGVVFTKTFTWNADGSPASVGEAAPGPTPDPLTLLSYVYDTAGRVSDFKKAGTTQTTWTYNATTSTVTTRKDGSLTTTFGYDWARRVTSITPDAAFTTGAVGRTYRLDGLLASQSFPSSVTETLAYDALKRPTSISLGTAGSLSQAFDRAGRVTSEGRNLNLIGGDAGTGTQNFNYDGLSRLTSSSGLSSINDQAYQYDLDGNRTRRVEGSTTTTDFTFDRTDEVIKQTISGTDRFSAYDAYGNQLSASDKSSATTTYTYDAANRLTTINPPTGGQITFAQDPLDRHASRSQGGSTIDTYQYTGPTETAWQTGNATPTSSLLDVDGSRLAIKTGTNVAWAVFDLHGSLVGLCAAGSTNTLSDAYRFDGYGQQLTSAGTATNPWRYRGLLNIGSDALTWALLDMGARDYSPQLGTFTQEDSVQGKAANPLTMNRYLYALANPATLIDPDGHFVAEFDSDAYSKLGRCQHIGDPGCGRKGVGQRQRLRAAAPKHAAAPCTTLCRRGHTARYGGHQRTDGSTGSTDLQGFSNLANGQQICFSGDCAALLFLDQLRDYAALVEQKQVWDEFAFNQIALAPLMVLPLTPIVEGEAASVSDDAAALTSGERAALLAARQAGAGGLATTRSPWALGPFARGVEIENMLGKNLPYTFKTIDNFDMGVATSIKSIDLGLKGYKAGEPILSRLSSAVKDLVAYKNSTMVSGGVTYEVGGLTTPITQKVLSVAIPPSATAEQVSALAAVAQYADSQGVIMIITVVK